MTVEIKSGGLWRTITAPEVKYSGLWRAIKTIEVKSGGIWREVFALVSGPTVSPNTANSWWNLNGPGFCYSMLQFRNDGIEYKNASANVSTTTNSSRGAWLDSGLASEVWVERILTVGHTLNQADPGAGRLNLAISRTYGVSHGGPSGFKLCGLTFNFYDAASGGSLIGSSGAITLRAGKNGD